jgi:hypothetical protein
MPLTINFRFGAENNRRARKAEMNLVQRDHRVTSKPSKSVINSIAEQNACGMAGVHEGNL